MKIYTINWFDKDEIVETDPHSFKEYAHAKIYAEEHLERERNEGYEDLHCDIVTTSLNEKN